MRPTAQKALTDSFAIVLSDKNFNDQDFQALGTRHRQTTLPEKPPFHPSLSRLT
jgi:hypothetical protein